MAMAFSEKCGDFLTDSYFFYLHIFHPPKAPYDGRSEDRLLRTLKKVREELMERTYMLKEMIRITILEKRKLEQKISESTNEKDNQHINDQLTAKSEYLSLLNTKLVELEDEQAEFHSKSMVLRSRIQSITTIGTVNHAIKQTELRKLRFTFDRIEKQIAKKEQLAGPLISEEELRVKVSIAEEARAELELIEHLLEKMDKFIKANEEI